MFCFNVKQSQNVFLFVATCHQFLIIIKINGLYNYSESEHFTNILVNQPKAVKLNVFSNLFVFLRQLFPLNMGN